MAQGPWQVTDQLAQVQLAELPLAPASPRKGGPLYKIGMPTSKPAFSFHKPHWKSHVFISNF